MASNNSLNLVDLDFNSLKNSFKNYLRNQAQFKDYDFEGSNINVLLDLLAYNTYKNAFYINMSLSESFLDSAQMLTSVLSHSKELNYVPRSYKSSKARVRVDFTVANPENQPYIIEKGSLFSTLIKNTSYSFSTPETVVVSSANNNFSFETDVYEGVYIQDSYIYSDSQENPRFRITNRNCDTTSITVVVYEDNEQIGTNYQLSTTLLDLNELSRVYFLQASENGYYEIIFGDGVVGRKPKNNAVILIDYRISSGSPANSGRVFSAAFNPTGGLDTFSNLVTTTIQTSIGGAEAEDIESIRYYAPRHFQVQERTVTTTDYEIALKTQFPEINAVSVYGGETVSPPQFGKVFVAVDVSDVDGLPESKRDLYYTFLKRRSPLSIDPIFIEPDYLYLYIDTLIKYDVGLTKLTPERIKTIVTQTINTYNQQNLDDFNSTLRYSQLVSEIDNSEPSIISNLTEITAYKKINPIFNSPQNIDVSFNIKLRNDLPKQEDVHPLDDYHALTSSAFTYAGVRCILEDDGDGTIRIMKFEPDRMIKVIDVGSIDYETGFIQITNFNISAYDGSALNLYVLPRDLDVATEKNTILTVEPSGIQIKVQAV
jgi:hypothetical protein